LQKLQDQYQKTADMITQVKDALNSMSDAAQRASDAKAAKKASATASSFADAAGGNFPDVGGNAKIGREGGLTDQSKLIDQWTKGETANLGKMFGSFDMFGPIKDMFRKAWDWIDKHTGGYASKAVAGIKQHMTASIAGAGIGAIIGGMIMGPLGAVLGGGIGAVIGSSLAKVKMPGGGGGGILKGFTSGLSDAMK